ncbi:MAG: 3-methyl-2-oxobutanoate hydroxymethyltransferase, partial [Ruminococcus sp.]|nr:3-methyl-2-oxobutanoate hydroxymethyltransferase [Ruminococcus sp.]
IHHTKAVTRGAKNAFVVADMPFMSYQTSTYDAVVNAGRLIKEGGASAVKLEGGAEVCEQIRAIVDSSIPVVAHLGLTPQSVNAFGGFKVQGKTLERAKQIIEDALKIQEAGACAVVLECVPAELARIITEKLDITATIGIGAGNGCDGQVLVYQDMLGLTTGHTPKFAKMFADAGETFRNGINAYIEETKNGNFPAPEHTFSIDDDIIAEIREDLK